MLPVVCHEHPVFRAFTSVCYCQRQTGLSALVVRNDTCPGVFARLLSRPTGELSGTGNGIHIASNGRRRFTERTRNMIATNRTINRTANTERELAAIDYKWLEGELSKQPAIIRSSTFNGRKLITAPMEDVRAFVVKNKQSFTAPFELQQAAVAE